MGKKALIALAEGFEEIEAVTPMDVLRRGGIEVTVAGIASREVLGAHGISIKADVLLKDYRGTPDAVVLPGGMPGAANLGKSPELKRLLEQSKAGGKLICAICASPGVVLAPLGLLEGKKATCYPSFEKHFGPNTTFVTDRVVRDGNLITSRGPGSAFEFALAIADALAGSGEAGKLSEAMLVAV